MQYFEINDFNVAKTCKKMNVDFLEKHKKTIRVCGPDSLVIIFNAAN